MSTKSTIFLTEDHDEHCFTDCNSPRNDVYGNYIGDDLFIEIDSRSIMYRGIDDKYIILGIKSGTEIHRILCSTRKPFVSTDPLSKIIEQIENENFSPPDFLLVHPEDAKSMGVIVPNFFQRLWIKIKSFFKSKP